ncbi:unnamed protein product [Trichogramma brassicae]|uniref:OB domain-containing protein n=1 Tax=Trichogramma brassicae TaxID=86971 RepID=A0A6H5IRI1_9HYME|nr:unnamed protein product [Trichogramma brassicae]
MSKRKRSNVDDLAVIKRINYDETTECVKLSSMSDIVKSWTVRGEVSSVSCVRTCTIGKSQKSVFNFELRDDTGVVRATAYGKTADKIHDKLQLQLLCINIKGLLFAYLTIDVVRVMI